MYIKIKVIYMLYKYLYNIKKRREFIIKIYTYNVILEILLKNIVYFNFLNLENHCNITKDNLSI